MRRSRGTADTERVLVPVARGRVLERKTLSWTGSGWSKVVEDAVYSVRMRELQAESVFQPADLTPSLIVTSWLEAGAEGGMAFDLERTDADLVVEHLRQESEHLRQDAKPERNPLVTEETAPVQFVA